jgi:hypothetical protein
MTRLIDPAIADLQYECDRARRDGRMWASRRARVRGSVAFLGLIAVHAVGEFARLMADRGDDDRRTLIRGLNAAPQRR